MTAKEALRAYTKTKYFKKNDFQKNAKWGKMLFKPEQYDIHDAHGIWLAGI